MRSRPGLLALVSAGLLSLPGSLAAQTVTIDHKPVGCMVAGKYPRLSACLSPQSQVKRARVYFRPEDASIFYYVEMKPSAPCFEGILPKPTRKLVGKKVFYYLDAADRSFAESRTEDRTAEVVATELDCKKDTPVAPAVTNASVTVFPSMPAGFAAGGIGTTALLAVGGAVAAVGGAGAALASGGGDKAPPPAPDQPSAPPQDPGGGTKPPDTPTPPTDGGKNRPPNADFRVSPDPPEGATPLDVTFNMCGTTDPDGDALHFTFDYGDGTTFKGDCRAKHNYAYPPGPSSAVATICVGDGKDGKNLHPDICQTYTVKVRNSCASDPRPPTVDLQVPVVDVKTDDPVVLNAVAKDTSGVTAVEFLAAPSEGRDVLLGVDRDAPFSVQWRNPPCGYFYARALAHDACGDSAYSATVPIHIDPPRCNPCSGDKPPSIKLDPIDGSKAPVVVSAQVSDAGGIDSVIFSVIDERGSTLFDLGRVSKPPYLVSWADPSCGTFTFEATAFDRCDHQTTVQSSPVVVTSCGPGILGPQSATAPASLFLSSDLRPAGVRGHVAVNGRAVLPAAAGAARVPAPVAPGDNLVEAVLSDGKGQGGTWRFELEGGSVGGTLRAEAGDVVQVTDRAIVFRLAGKPGERVAFRFAMRR